MVENNGTPVTGTVSARLSEAYTTYAHHILIAPSLMELAADGNGGKHFR